MIQHASISRTLPALLSSADNRNAIARAKVASFLLYLTQTRTGDLRQGRDLTSLVSRLSKLISDQNPEARAAGRETVRILVLRDVVTVADLEKSISADVLEKCLRERSESYDTSGLSVGGSAVPSSMVQERGRGEGGGRHRSPRRVGEAVGEGNRSRAMRTSDEPQEKGWEGRRGVSLGEAPHVPQPDPDLRLSVLANGIVPITRGPPGKKDKERDKDSLPEMGDATKAGRDQDQSVAAVPALVSLLYTSKNWLERRNGLITLSDMVVSKCSSLQSAGRLEEVLDAIFSRVEDGHAKVIRPHSPSPHPTLPLACSPPFPPSSTM